MNEQIFITVAFVALAVCTVGCVVVLPGVAVAIARVNLARAIRLLGVIAVLVVLAILAASVLGASPASLLLE